MAYVIDEMTHTVASNEGEVILSIVIGDDQKFYSIGVNRVNGPAVFNKQVVTLGKGSELRGKSTSVHVSVTDANEHTNSTSVTLSLTNSVASKVFPKNADTDNGTVDYYLTIKHI